MMTTNKPEIAIHLGSGSNLPNLKGGFTNLDNFDVSVMGKI